MQGAGYCRFESCRLSQMGFGGIGRRTGKIYTFRFYFLLYHFLIHNTIEKSNQAC